MRHFLALLILFVTPTAFAQAISPDEIVTRIHGVGSFAARTAATNYCKNELQNWRADSYKKNMRRLGTLWNTYPDAAYLVLDTCQGEWMSRYFNPARFSEGLNAEDQKQNALLAPLLGFFRTAALLPQEVRAYMGLRKNNYPDVPPAPYELLLNIAASERGLEVAVHRQMSEAINTIVTSGGLLATTLAKTSKFAELVKTTAGGVGRIYKQALFGALVVGLAGKAVDYGLWEMRHHELTSRLRELENMMLQRQGPMPVLLDEYMTTVENFGYFLNFEVYLKETDQDLTSTVKPQECTRILNDFYAARTKNPATQIRQFTNSETCADAAVVWNEAAAFLKSNFKTDADAQYMSTKLSEHAASVFLGYVATWAYLETLPICRPSMTRSSLLLWMNDIQYDCFDRKTGGQIL